MSTYSFLIKGRAKSEKKSLFCWFESKSDSRAEREIMNILEDNDIATGRGADYQLPVRTDFPVFDDLPTEFVLDDTWCDRYELAEDGKTFRKIVVAPPAPPEQPAATAPLNEGAKQEAAPTVITANDANFYQRTLGAWLFGVFKFLTPEQIGEVNRLQMDMDATYPQNVLLALGNITQLRHCFPETLFDLIAAIKAVWPETGKSPELGHILSFAEEWMQAHNYAIPGDDRPNRMDVTAKWVAKHNPPHAAAPKLDRPAGFPFTLDSLDIEIACALLPMDFDIHEIPGPIARRAKEMVEKREEPWRQWSQKLRQVPDILTYPRATIFPLIRDGKPDLYHFPTSHQTWIDARLRGELPTTIDTIAGEDPLLDSPVFATASPAAQPEVKSLGDVRFSVDLEVPEREGPFYLKNPSTGKCRQIYNPVKLRALLASGYVEMTFNEYLDVSFAGGVEEVEHAPNTENTGNVQMEKTDSPEGKNSPQLPAGESNDAQQEAPPLPLIALDNLEHRLALVEKKLAFLGDIGIEFQRIGLESLE
ncbi:RecE family exodeoxyribonuclease [Sodalis sp. dw_96]|uniref:RecE family exodeoxyribonuclease n=1 Tax=Sodalis sp. dw_96 TaxID=2719794 RepID=UPI001BD5EA7D|nr:RecE family exodeoxyribonuclease [Sodalis sp. dw_96]